MVVGRIRMRSSSCALWPVQGLGPLCGSNERRNPSKGSISLGSASLLLNYFPHNSQDMAQLLKDRHVVLKNWLEVSQGHCVLWPSLGWELLEEQGTLSRGHFEGDGKYKPNSRRGYRSWYTFTKTKRKMYPEKWQILLYWSILQKSVIKRKKKKH